MRRSSPEAVGMSSDRLNNIDVKMQDYVNRRNAPGFITLAAREGQVVHYETCGFRDVEQQLPMEKDTIFRIYSMTKPITSIALMMLYEQGAFQLFEPVSKYIPAFGKTKALRRMGYLGQELVEQDPPMTIHHLLTHTAGLSYGFFNDTPIDNMYRHSIFRRTDVSLAEKIKGMAELPLRHQPGAAWNYSIATDVCGYLVETLADMPFEDFLQQKIFDPLGMVDTHFHVPAEKQSRFAKLYQHHFLDGSFYEYQGAPHIPAQDFTAPVKAPSGGGGLVSTTEDYWRFARMLLNKGKADDARLLGRKTVEYMTVNHLKPNLLPIGIGPMALAGKGFGLGFEVVIDAAQTGVINSNGNYGWGGAAATHFWVDPQERMVGIIMTQLMDNMLPFQSDFRALCYQALID